MIRVPPGAVILDPAEVDFVGRALEHLGQLMAERRDAEGNPTPSQPSARLSALIARLRRAVVSTDALAVDDSGADHEQQAEPPARNASGRASQRDSMNAGPHDIGTAEAARRLGITPNGVRDAIRHGRLPGRRSRGRWVVDSAAVADHAARKAGRRGG
ncbi:helix-turn-helix domain-containing protein [Mycobacterium sp. 29Ha]|uniref:helix-turn-helix domain-containing protein n=1 Tax=Mycobacterium sp. 29Ha TaxID=2939268 RepID=UPI00293933F5|nr:helix-turn-helix domain-containing protein [Mycobacterium sp. 29Ha]MDV3136750.1 helix-turn-helix domain-containing protein [Mycobacterium sp. 29Ha]